jgi:hypothetical protein
MNKAKGARRERKTALSFGISPLSTVPCVSSTSPPAERQPDPPQVRFRSAPGPLQGRFRAAPGDGARLDRPTGAWTAKIGSMNENERIG